MRLFYRVGNSNSYMQARKKIVIICYDFFFLKGFYTPAGKTSLQKPILAEEKEKKNQKTNISYFLSVPFHFQSPKSKADIPFQPNNTVAGCSLQLGALHGEFIPLAGLCHAGAPFGEVFPAPAGAPSLPGTRTPTFPRGASCHGHCRA